MIFTETKLKGAFVVAPEFIKDERGFFARLWTPEEFEERGLNPRLVQSNISYNRTKGTLRGMHFQVKPHEEAKLVRCTRGSLYDVALDIRPDSPTYLQWEAVELTEENRLMFYVPEGFAHGYQTLEDDTEVFYQMSELYHPESARGLRWDDPKLGIRWPLPVSVISQRDTQFELL
ncbi:MAG TPA: dTDP-4-dehydrorhamnose 3,5-epimerase [Pyrinomonadaceae bacterium]|nr:dTDP-4-dehydrorhamnose 3,5-epimerase [Pyrinomonadaceae bacterium]